MICKPMFGARWWRNRHELVTLRISRQGTELHDPLKGAAHVTRAVLGYIASHGETQVFAVGRDGDDMRADIERAKIEGKLPASFTVIAPGQSQWWDAQLRWPPDRRSKLTAPLNETQALFHNPFQKDVWCPPGIEAFLSYVLAYALGFPQMVWLRRTVRLEISSDFDSVERAEIVDAVDARWGRSRVVGADDVVRLFRPLRYAPLAAVALLGLSIGCHAPPLMLGLITLAVIAGTSLLERLEKVAPRR